MPVQGGWTSWVNTAPCSSRCADGMQTRIRSCSRPTPAYGGEDCIGDSKDAVQCGSNSCGIYIAIVYIHAHIAIHVFCARILIIPNLILCLLL